MYLPIAIAALLSARVLPIAARDLQSVITEDMCSAPTEDATFVLPPTAFSDDELTVHRSGLFERCMESIPVNGDNMLQHIGNLNKLFQQYQ